jgi:4,5-dihydroxyphthalate decarboxylase
MNRAVHQKSVSPRKLSRREWFSGAIAAGAFAAISPSIAGTVLSAPSPQSSKIQLSMCLSDNDRTRPLREGRIKIDGVDPIVSTAHPSEMFWRELHFSEFDISEMSCSSLLMAIAHGDNRFVAIPVFTSRSIFHTGILIRTDRGIEKPADLKSKKVAVPEYQQTAALWCRGALEHEFGVTAFDIDWYMERTEELSHASATGFQPPKGLKLQHIPEQESIGSMLVAGRVDASLLYLNEVNLVDRSRVDLKNRSDIRTLFADPVAEGIRYYKKTGFYPINHCVVFKREVAEKYPWAVLNVFKAFDEAKNQVREQGRAAASPYFELGLINPEQRKALDVDPFGYGVKANRSVLESITQFSFEQGLTPRRLKLEEVFHPATLDL